MQHILIIGLFILLSPLFSLEFHNLSFDKAMELAKKENKLVFLMVEEKYCPWCKKMKSKTLKDKKVMSILNEDYINIKIDKSSRNLSKKFKTRFVPTMFIIDPQNGKELSKTIGYMRANYFYDVLFNASRFDD